MRKALLAAGVLVVLLLVADRVTEALAAHAVAVQLRDAGELTHDPSVTIRGFPFLTQAISGRYDEVRLSADRLDRGSVRLSKLQVVVRGARVPLGQALSGRVESVPVESVTAQTDVAFADLAAQSALSGARIAPAGKGVSVTGRVTVFGNLFTVTSRCTVALDAGDIVLTPQTISVEGGSNNAVDRVLREQLHLRVSVGTLPYGLRLSGLRVTKEGLALTAHSGPTVLQRP